MAELNVRKRGTKWEYRFEAAKVDGKRNQISKSGFRTKKEALEAGTKALAEYNNAGLRFEPSEISVSDYLDYWLKNYCKVNLADSTMTGYRNIINNHLKPYIGMYKLKSITPMILQEMVNDIAINKGFTRSYLKNILKVLKGAFRYAVLPARLISNTPAENVALPKIDIAKKEDDIIILSKDEVSKMLERFENSKYQYMAMLTAYYTGLRVGEVFGLTWDNIDFVNKALTVDKIAKKIEKDGATSEGKRKRGIRGKATTRWYFGACKTPSSYRTIKIGDTLIIALKDYKDWQEANEAEYAELYTKYYLKDELSDTGREVQRLIPMQQIEYEIPLEIAYPVFIKENGEFHGSDSIKYVSKIINHELGINFNFHAFRHTHATMLIESGVPVKAVADRLGHGNVRTTLETYVHTTDTMESDAVNKFECFGNLNDKKVVNIRDVKKDIIKEIAK